MRTAILLVALGAVGCKMPDQPPGPGPDPEPVEAIGVAGYARKAIRDYAQELANICEQPVPETEAEYLDQIDRETERARRESFGPFVEAHSAAMRTGGEWNRAAAKTAGAKAAEGFRRIR